MIRRRPFLLLLPVGAALLFLCLCVGPSGFGIPADPAVLRLRLLRVAAGVAVGAALSCAGVILQALLRNPLAEPYVLGVSGGAGLGAAAAILSGFATLGAFVLPAAAFAGAATALLLVLWLARDSSAPTVHELLLSGVIVSAMCSSVLMMLVAVAPVEGLHTVVWWMLGNLEPESGRLLAACAAAMGAGVAAAWLLSPELNAMTIGRETAHHVGVRTARTVYVGLGAATLMTAAAVGLAGLIGFVGLIVPHGVRGFTGPDHRRLVPASALAGGVFLAVCDALARTLLAPVELPVGVITALFGGPFFLAVLRRRRRQSWIE